MSDSTRMSSKAMFRTSEGPSQTMLKAACPPVRLLHDAAVEFEAQGHAVGMVPAHQQAAADGDVPAAEVEVVGIAVGLDRDAVVPGADEAILDEEALAGHGIDAVQSPGARVGEDFDVAVDGIDAVGHGVGPAAGAAHEDALYGQVLAAVDAEVAAKRAPSDDPDVFAGSGKVSVDQGAAGDVDGHVVLQDHPAGVMDARTEIPHAGRAGSGDIFLQGIGEQGQVRLSVDADVEFPGAVNLEGQPVFLDGCLDTGAGGLDGIVLDRVRRLDDDGLRAFAGKVRDMEAFHAVRSDLLDPDGVAAGGERVVGAGLHIRNRRICDHLLGEGREDQHDAQ